MDTDGGPQADNGGEQGLIIRTSFILSGAHQATQVFDDWWLMADVDLTKTEINPLKRMAAAPFCYASASVL